MKNFEYHGEVITASSKKEAIKKILSSRTWDNTDEWCQNYKEDFDDLWLPKINSLKKKLNKLNNIEFVVYYGDKTDSNLYFNKWAKWAYEQGYDIGSAPIKLKWWIKDTPTTNNTKFVEDVEKEINKKSEDDTWVFNNTYDTFDGWYDTIKKANDYIEKNHKVTPFKYHVKSESIDENKTVEVKSSAERTFSYKNKIITANSKKVTAFKNDSGLGQQIIDTVNVLESFHNVISHVAILLDEAKKKNLCVWNVQDSVVTSREFKYQFSVINKNKEERTYQIFLDYGLLSKTKFAKIEGSTYIEIQGSIQNDIKKFLGM